MKVKELVDEIRNQKSDIVLGKAEAYIPLYYKKNVDGNKFLEIHGSSNDEVTQIKFHENTNTDKLNAVDKPSGDTGPVNKHFKIGDKDILIEIALRSYEAVKKKAEKRE